MLTKRLLVAALAAALLAAGGIAHAYPLTIETTQASRQEPTGDPGGTQYPWTGAAGAGAGVPSQDAGWPVGPGFEPEAGGAALGTSGWDAAYLRLDKPSWVSFEFMGAGNSGFENSFWLNIPGTGWTQLFQDGQASNPTYPCQVSSGAQFPSCGTPQVLGGLPDAGKTYNQYTFFLPAGLIPFAFDIGFFDVATGTTIVNGGLGGPINDPASGWNWGGLTPAFAQALGNPSDDSHFPGFFLGVDPYLATGPFQLSGSAVYAGLSDRERWEPGTTGHVIEHDYQDMIVRISVVPEPGTLALVGAALWALALARRRRPA